MSTPRPEAVSFEVADLSLTESGKRRIDWAFQSMPVLQAVRKQLIKSQPFSAVQIIACLPVTAAGANLLITLRDGGAQVAVAGTRRVDDEVAASLVADYAMPVRAEAAGDAAARQQHLLALLGTDPSLLLDHDGELTALCCDRQRGGKPPSGAVVETREGARTVRRRAAEGKLEMPVIASHQSLVRQSFHARFGAAQGALDAIIRTFHLLIAGLNVVVAGFGATGRGIAARAAGLGANVIVTEVDPLRALEAAMEGFRVTSIAEAAGLADLVITASGNRSVIGREHFDKLRSGAILCNAGHSAMEMDLATLKHLESSRRSVQPEVDEITMRDGRRVYLLNQGLPFHAHTAENQVTPVLDLAFANQVLSAEYLLQHRSSLENRVYPVPREIDRQIARLKLDTMGVKIDRLTVEQEQYLASLSDDS